MAERSAAERIRLWYKEFDFALQQTQREFNYSHPMYHGTVAEADRRFAEAIANTARRADYLRDNPAEVVADRGAASRERVDDLLRQASELAHAEQHSYEEYGEEADYETEWEPDDAYRPLLGPDNRPYATQYTGMLGSTPDRLEIDTSDTDLGARWQDQLAALDARLEALMQDVAERDQQHEQGEGLSY